MPALSVRLLLLVALAVVAPGACSLPQRGAIRLANRAIKDGNYNYALEELTAAEKYGEPTDEVKAEIGFLRGRSYEELKRMPEAESMFRYVADTFPASPYAYLAKEKLRQLETGSTLSPDTVATVEERQYLQGVKAKMDSVWTHPCPGPKRPDCDLREVDVILQFGINADGQLAFLRIQKSSGFPAYDEHVVNVLKDAAPFDALPESVRLRKPLLQVTARFSYRNKSRSINRE